MSWIEWYRKIDCIGVRNFRVGGWNNLQKEELHLSCIGVTLIQGMLPDRLIF